jgi:putative protease
MLELLSPALSPEAVIAAVQSGADAIYICFGGSAKSGFTEEDFFKAVRYCRIRACKVYAEIDTLLGDDELQAAANLARRSSEAGVSAMVLQDLGLASVLRSVVPDMELHAGERLGFYSLAGVEAAAQMGFSRVRLPLEMSLQEIEFIAAHASARVEVAVQSTTCFSRAGICSFSAFLDRKSANRGNCSGLCREHYSMGGRMDDDLPLCLKDVCLINRLKELDAAGVACVRIGECAGKPELTALLTGIYSRCKGRSHSLTGRAGTD